MTEPTTAAEPTAAERFRTSVDQRIAKLNPGQGMSRERRKHVIDWCRIHLEHVRTEAVAAIEAEARRSHCDHGMSAHGADGCIHCDCKVPGFEARQQDGSALRTAVEVVLGSFVWRGKTHWTDREMATHLADAVRNLAALPPSAPPADWTDPGITTPNPDGTVTWQPTPDGFSGGKVKPKPPKMPPSAPPALDVGLLARALHDSTWACPTGQVVSNWCDPRRGELFHVSQAESIAAEYAQLQEPDR